MHDDEQRISVVLRRTMSDGPQNYEEILRSESRLSRTSTADTPTPSQGGSIHSYYTALSAGSTTPSIESGTTAESSLYLQCDGLRLRPITPELVPNDGLEYIRMAASDGGHEEELLRSPYVDSDYDSRPFSLQKPVLRSASLSRLSALTPTVRPKLSVITHFPNPNERRQPEPTVTIFKKEQPQQPQQPKLQVEKSLPPPPPESEPARSVRSDKAEDDSSSATLTTQMTGATSSTAKTSDTFRASSQMLGSMNNSSFRLSPISATIEHAFKADIRVGRAPVSNRPILADIQNRKSLMAVPGTPEAEDYMEFDLPEFDIPAFGNASPPALSPDTTGDQACPPICTPPGIADGTAPLPVVTKPKPTRSVTSPFPMLLPPPKKADTASPAKPESPAVITAPVAGPAPAPSAYRAPTDSVKTPAITSPKIGGNSTGMLSRSSSTESIRSLPPKPPPTCGLPPIPVKAKGSSSSLRSAAKGHAVAAATAAKTQAPELESSSTSKPAVTEPRETAAAPAKAEVPAPAPKAEEPTQLPTSPRKPLPQPQPRALPPIVTAFPSPPQSKPERKPRSLPPIPGQKPPASALPTPPARKVTVRRPLPPVPKPREDADEQLLSPTSPGFQLSAPLSAAPRLPPVSPISPMPGLPVNATNALKKITINTNVVTNIRMSLASTPVDFSAHPGEDSPSTPKLDVDLPPTCPLFDAYGGESPTEIWTSYPKASARDDDVEEDGEEGNRVSFYHAI